MSLFLRSPNFPLSINYVIIFSFNSYNDIIIKIWRSNSAKKKSRNLDIVSIEDYFYKFKIGSFKNSTKILRPL